ncbi:hypothetical protein BDQ17DRAFT_1498187 [Cyathus striatus]|nr:hypothetical protein BDQ17DRAFT_1498187 [Cyathus striatus]
MLHARISFVGAPDGMQQHRELYDLPLEQGRKYRFIWEPPPINHGVGHYVPRSGQNVPQPTSPRGRLGVVSKANKSTNGTNSTRTPTLSTGLEQQSHSPSQAHLRRPLQSLVPVAGPSTPSVIASSAVQIAVPPPLPIASSSRNTQETADTNTCEHPLLTAGDIDDSTNTEPANEEDQVDFEEIEARFLNFEFCSDAENIF